MRHLKLIPSDESNNPTLEQLSQRLNVELSESEQLEEYQDQRELLDELQSDIDDLKDELKSVKTLYKDFLEYVKTARLKDIREDAEKLLKDSMFWDI